MTVSLILFFLIAIVNIFVGLCRKREKLFYVLALGLIFIFMTFNCVGPDIGGYISAYKEWITPDGVIIRSGHMEWGYMYLMSACRRMGLDFFSFRIILSLVCLILFVNTIKYYKVNPNFVVGLYMTYLFFFDTIQLRNCVATFILLFATRYLFQKSFCSTVKYVFLILIAWGFHTIALFSLFFLLVKISPKKLYYQVIIIISGLMFILCIVLQPKLPIITNWLLQFIKRGSSYLEINVEIGYLVIIMLQLVGFIPLCILRGAVKYDRVVIKNVDNIIRINIVIFLFVPLLFINSNFYRIYRNYILLTMIGLVLIYEKSNRKTKNRDLAAVSLLLLDIGWFIRDMVIKNDITVIINPIFEGNIFKDFTQTINVIEWLGVFTVSILICMLIRLFYKEIKSSKRLKVLQVKRTRYR